MAPYLVPYFPVIPTLRVLCLPILTSLCKISGCRLREKTTEGV